MTSRLKPHCIATCSKLPHCLPSYITEAFCGRVIIPEEGSWKQMWDMMVLMLILYSGLIVPFRICFDAPASGLAWGIELFISLTFLADLWLSFRTAYLVDDSWVTSPSAITHHYLRTWFWVDAPAAIPLELLDIVSSGSSTSSSSGLKLLRLLRLFRLLRLLKLLKLDAILERLEDILDIDLRIMQLFVLLIKVLFVGHLLACFWYAVAAGAEAGHFGDTPEDKLNWVTEYHDTLFPDQDEKRSKNEMYVWSMYWAITTLTTVGYGDIVPANNVERVYTTFAQLIGAVIFATMMAQISTLMMALDRQAALIEEKLDGVKEYVASRKLAKPLAARVKRHFKYYYSRRPAFDEIALLNECPPSLRADVQRFILQGTLGKLPLFSQHLDPEFMSEVFPFIKPVSYVPGDVIFSKGEVSRDLLFLLEGEVNVMSNKDPELVEKRLTPTEEIFVDANAEANEPTLTVQHNGCFGETILVGYRRQATHIASTSVETLSLSRKDLLDIFQQNPRCAKRLVSILMQDFRKKERLQDLSRKLILGWVTRGSELWAALAMQQVWNKFYRRLLAKPLLPHEALVEAGAEAPSAAPVAAPATAPAAAPAAVPGATVLTTPLTVENTEAVSSILQNAETRMIDLVMFEFVALRQQIGIPGGRMEHLHNLLSAKSVDISTDSES